MWSLLSVADPTSGLEGVALGFVGSFGFWVELVNPTSGSLLVYFWFTSGLLLVLICWFVRCSVSPRVCLWK
jgi:hypothetical protein